MKRAPPAPVVDASRMMQFVIVGDDGVPLPTAGAIRTAPPSEVERDDRISKPSRTVAAGSPLVKSTAAAPGLPAQSIAVSAAPPTLRRATAYVPGLWEGSDALLWPSRAEAVAAEGEQVEQEDLVC